MSIKLLAPLAFVAVAPLAQAAPPPNVIVIIADDLGYGDVSAYGVGKLKTPNLDRMCSEGLRFTQGYAPASTCTPSRYALMTGEYAWRQKGTGVLPGDAKLIISPTRVTLPKIFKDAGYMTGLVGKWHLGMGEGPAATDFNGHVQPGPNEVGFAYAFNMAATGDRVPCVYMENGRVVGLDPNDPIVVSYGKKKVGNRPTLREIKSGAIKSGFEPVRLDSLNDQHSDTLINGIGRIGFMGGGASALWDDRTLGDTFTEKALGFIEKNKGRPFFLVYAAHEPHAPRDPHPRFVGKSGMGLRGDAILQFDDAVGRILAKLKEQGLDERTLVILSSDNGPAVTDGYADRALEAEQRAGHDASGGLCGGKYMSHEGGVRVPFIVRWPGSVAAGRVTPAIVTLADIPALAAELTGRPLPSEAAPDSFGFLGVLKGSDVSPAPYIVLGCHDDEVIRKGDWKLFCGGKGAPALYDLARDPDERHNVAAKHPEIVSELNALYAETKKTGYTRPGATAVRVR